MDAYGFVRAGPSLGKFVPLNMVWGSMLTVITPSLNCLGLLKKTITSVESESANYRNLRIQHLIIDGASHDGTQEFLSGIDSSKLQWVSRPDESLYEAIADGLRLTEGQAIVLLGSGDLLMPGAAEKILGVVQNEGVLWGSGVQCFHSPVGRLGYISRTGPAVFNRLAQSGAYGHYLPAIQQESTFFCRSLIESIDLGYLASLKLAGDNYIWSCFAEKTHHRRVTFAVGSFLVHPGQLSENRSAYIGELRRIFPTRLPLPELILELGAVVCDWLWQNKAILFGKKSKPRRYLTKCLRGDSNSFHSG